MKNLHSNQTYDFPSFFAPHDTDWWTNLFSEIIKIGYKSVIQFVIGQKDTKINRFRIICKFGRKNDNQWVRDKKIFQETDKFLFKSHGRKKLVKKVTLQKIQNIM